jgi:2-oxoacid:acceptor oxidoreductase delta subunit (pyruvate/2-ketoisovalerate family)
MTAQTKRTGADSLFISRSTRTCEGNKTGSWRFLKPGYLEKTAPCSAACPAGEDVGRIEMLTSQGQLKEAWETILQENPFPGVCGRVCYHPCEQVCNRGLFDEPIAVQIIERSLAENAERYGLKPDLERLPLKNKKIAIIGAGPSGLAAGYFLTRLGYACHLFESRNEAGGMLRFGIPSYRLPVTPLRTEIERIVKTGLTLHLGQTVTERFFEDARGHYDAVLIGCGLGKTPALAISGEGSAGVEDGLSFLRQINQEGFPALEGVVAVLGGGNTAIDVARSVKRLGAKVLILYRRRRQDMPAFEEEIEMALEEGVELRELWTPLHIQPEGKALRLTGQVMQVTGIDRIGRAQVEPVPGKTETVLVTRIFKAIGLEAAEDWIIPPASRDQNIMALPNSLILASPQSPVQVFVGDLAVTTKSVVQAVGSAKEAALALDVYFQKGLEAVEAELSSCRVGNGPALSLEMYLKGPRSARNPHLVDYEEINHDHFQFSPRIIYPRLLKTERVQSFAEINLKISADLAMREAKRCFNCGLCNQCDNCRLFCPDLAVLKEETPQGRRINYDYCKGCGICVVECPRNAMVLEEEN